MRFRIGDATISPVVEMTRRGFDFHVLQGAESGMA